MKHTPGPWKVSNMIDGTGHTMATVDEDVKGSFREICRSYDLEPDDIAETVANMRLIAAAPDLLEALRKITFAYKADAETKDEYYKTLLKLSFSVMAKAEGNQS